jgi:3-hydroxyacyl-[acyl-carrier-protein] dehydratase
MKNIEALIPHRDPFLFVDELVSVDKDEIIGLKTFSDTFVVFSGHNPERKIVPGVILIEAMAQCGGAGAKKLIFLNQDLYVLAMLDNARFHGEVEPGQLVTMVIRNLKVRNRGIKQSGTAHCQGKLVAEATWWCVKQKL